MGRPARRKQYRSGRWSDRSAARTDYMRSRHRGGGERSNTPSSPSLLCRPLCTHAVANRARLQLSFLHFGPARSGTLLMDLEPGRSDQDITLSFKNAFRYYAREPITNA